MDCLSIIEGAFFPFIFDILLALDLDVMPDSIENTHVTVSRNNDWHVDKRVLWNVKFRIGLRTVSKFALWDTFSDLVSTWEQISCDSHYPGGYVDYDPFWSNEPKLA